MNQSTCQQVYSAYSGICHQWEVIFVSVIGLWTACNGETCYPTTCRTISRFPKLDIWYWILDKRCTLRGSWSHRPSHPTMPRNIRVIFIAASDHHRQLCCLPPYDYSFRGWLFWEKIFMASTQLEFFQEWPTTRRTLAGATDNSINDARKGMLLGHRDAICACVPDPTFAACGRQIPDRQTPVPAQYRRRAHPGASSLGNASINGMWAACSQPRQAGTQGSQNYIEDRDSRWDSQLQR